ncbi:GDSL esterase/lipase [Artemisia annua]|uniref:GDSL esterase/lipase n=1 Tax=Artemisia annua TaxID=35608 RepID=A0A2U1PWJ4_ARTAN|nr:GDSL esterase/lipase [Artemisia annua]
MNPVTGTQIKFCQKSGFGDPFLVCCGRGGRYNFDYARRCASTDTVNGKKILLANSCENPSSRIIWDEIYFTEAANKWIYDQIVDGTFSDPPVPLKMANKASLKVLPKISSIDINKKIIEPSIG